jgi:hypothetical protein
MEITLKEKARTANTVYKKLLVLAGTKLVAPLPASVLFRKILVHEHATFHTHKR